MNTKRWTEIFKNPLYAGIMVSRLLDYELVDWKYESIITKEIFQKVNLKMKGKTIEDYRNEKPEDEYYAKGILLCECQSSFTAYMVKKKNLHYYICTNFTCRTNISANSIHRKMEELIQGYSVNPTQISYVKEQLYSLMHELNVVKEKKKEELSYQKKLLEDKLSRLENKFIDDELDMETYRKHKHKLNDELAQTYKELNKGSSKKSNQCIYIDFFLEIASNSHFLWQKGDYYTKKNLLKLLFPRGLVYSKKNDESRTSEMNSIFRITHSLLANYEGIKKGQTSKNTDLSDLVPQEGVLSNLIEADLAAIAEYREYLILTKSLPNKR